MKGKASATAIGIGIGVALCNPAAGAVVAGAGVVGGIKSLANLAPPPGYHHKPVKPMQALFATTLFLSIFGMLATLGTLVCDDVCGMTPSNRLITLGVFFGVLLLSGVGMMSIPDYTDQEAAEVWRTRDQREWRSIWNNKHKYYLRSPHNIPDGQKYLDMAYQMFGKSHPWMFPEYRQETAITPAQTAIQPAQQARKPKALPEPVSIQVSEDNGATWFTVEQLTEQPVSR